MVWEVTSIGPSCLGPFERFDGGGGVGHRDGDGTAIVEDEAQGWAAVGGAERPAGVHQAGRQCGCLMSRP